MRIVLCLVVTFLSQYQFAQLVHRIETFEDLSGVGIDSINTYDKWHTTIKHYPSGRKQDEVRVLISSGCDTEEKCRINYQHQVYYDEETSTIAVKEGKYVVIKNGRARYRYYGWWYTKDGRCYRKIKEKATKHL
ncbi:hypothetical protein [Parvicella tangerina]|nr:hypothetical protein [Parvicella tangerina]